MSTYMTKKADIQNNWHHIDADGLVLGRLAAQIATLLRGKHKPNYTPHIDNGDFVVVTNAPKVFSHRNDTEFHWHTGHPGGIKSRTREQILNGKTPTKVLVKAVERMMPKGPLGYAQMARLKVYAEAEHPHTAQNPKPFDFKSKNSKNTPNA